MKTPSKPPAAGAARDTTSARKARLAAALRDNLRKRKAQARSRVNAGSSGGGGKDQADGEDE